MKKLLGTIIVVMMFLGCNSGGGGSNPAAPSHTPSISNLSYAPSSVFVGYGGGATTVYGTFDYIDTGGDISTLRITSSCGADITGPMVPASGANPTAGTATFVVTGISTTTSYSCTVQLWVIDGKGSASNKLSGTFSVI